MMAELGYFESQWDYALESDDGTRIGKYQVDAASLAALNYIKPGAVAQYGNNTLQQDESWTGQDSIYSLDDFSSNESLQDVIQFQEFNSNYNALLSNGGITAADDICVLAGMLFVAHQFRSADLAKAWRDTGQQVDQYQRNGSVYFNHGRYSIDVLSANA